MFSSNKRLLQHTYTRENTLNASVILHELTYFYIPVLVAGFFNGKVNELTKTMQKYIHNGKVHRAVFGENTKSR